MRFLLTLLVCIIANFSYGQIIDPIQELSFTYDNAGNQTKRELICLGCRKMSDQTNVKNSIADSDFIKSTEYPQIQYFPNPVSYELQVKWTTDKTNFVSVIKIYSINGQHLKTYPNLEKNNDIKIPFSNYQEGMYNMILHYCNGEEKNFKILKKQE
jgi:hypothetical protein